MCNKTYFLLELFCFSAFLTSPMLCVDENKLIEHLFRNYSPRVRPVRNYTEPIEVYVKFNLLSIVDINTKEQYLQFRSYFALFWKDEYLNWEDTNYTDIKRVMVSESDVWKPDLGVENCIEGYTKLESGLNVGIEPDGMILSVPSGSFRTLCTVKVDKIPFDTQLCSIVLTPWLTIADMQNINLAIPGMDLFDYHPNSQWELVNVSSACYLRKDIHMQYCVINITVTRRSTYFVLYLVCPATLLSAMTPFVFVIPTSSGEKLSFSVAIFLSYSVFQTTLKENMPVTSDFSYIVYYIQINFILGGIQTIISILLLQLGSNEEHKVGPTWSVLKAITLKCKDRKRQRCDKLTVGVDPSSEGQHKEIQPDIDKCVTWAEVHDVIDRMLFFVFFFISVLMFLALLLGWFII